MNETCTLTGCYSARVTGSVLCNAHHNDKYGVKAAVISDCASKACRNKATHGKMFCEECSMRLNHQIITGIQVSDTRKVPPIAHVFEADKVAINGKVIQDQYHDRRGSDQKMCFKYPKYYKEVPAGVTELDIYMVCHMFQIQDYSGALHHAIKKILLPGVRTGGKSRRDDIKEARDTLTRWLEIHK